MPPVISGKEFKLKVSSYLKDNYPTTDCTIIDNIPKSWEKYGELILFPDCSFIHEFRYKDISIWEYICQLLNGKRIAARGKISHDFRTPKTRLIYGNDSLVEILDNGIKYSWDIEKIMFCRGNASERHRIAKLNCKEEVIVDLFAGIGYFTLPYLVHAKAKSVYACEWNPTAVFYLRKNLELNKVADRCVIIEGDNRLASLENIGHRINVGIIPNSEEYWLTACKALHSSGGVIYIHQNVVVTDVFNKETEFCSKCEEIKNQISFTNEMAPFVMTHSGSFFSPSDIPHIVWNKKEIFFYSLHISHVVLNYLMEINKNNWSVSVKEYFNVKSYAPHIDHLVFAVYSYPLDN